MSNAIVLPPKLYHTFDELGSISEECMALFNPCSSYCIKVDVVKKFYKELVWICFGTKIFETHAIFHNTHLQELSEH